MELKPLCHGSKSANRKKVLIVPYGIETCFKCASCIVRDVLIVPYGIETQYTIYTLLIQFLC